MKSGVLAAALLLVGGLVFAQIPPSPAPTAPAKTSVDAAAILRFLNQTIDWYRQQTSLQRIADDPDDASALNDSRQMADQVVRLGFEFARAESEAASVRNSGSQNVAQSPDLSQYQGLARLQAKLDQQIKDTQAEVDTLRQKLEAARGKKRQQLQAQVEETEAEIDLAKARRDAIQNMTQFVSGAGSNGGSIDLKAQVQALADSVPVVLSTSANGSEAKPGAKEQPAPSPITAAGQASPSGIWDLTADLFALTRKIHTVDTAAQQTAELAKRTGEMRAPLVSSLKGLSARGDDLAKTADTADAATLAQRKVQLDALATQFKQVATAALPLSKQRILLRLYQQSLANWRGVIAARRATELKGLAVRLGILGFMIGIVVAGSALWRRAVYRYVHNPRRRHQALLLRKCVMWFLIVMIIAFAFASKLGSIVTFAGLITAGIVVALQNVVLSVVGYFLLIGKYGIRVGDRVQIGGVTGEVIDIGLVRLHLMELTTDEYVPTGRVVAFANTIVFQPAAGLFKQIPGTNFLWHEITLKLAPETNYAATKERLLHAVERVLADYQEELDRQNRAMAHSMVSISPNEFRPKIQVRFTSAALEAVLRFPVDLHRASEIDERVTHELLRELDREPRLKLVSSDGPGLRDVTLTYS